jgi:hypothetical protein
MSKTSTKNFKIEFYFLFFKCIVNTGSMCYRDRKLHAHYWPYFEASFLAHLVLPGWLLDINKLLYVGHLTVRISVGRHSIGSRKNRG